MTKGIPVERRIRVLLNTLAGERYMRRSLLSELVDDLALDNEHPAALQASRVLLERLSTGIDDAEFERRIDRVRELSQA